MAKRRRNAGTFYDVIDTSNGYAISRSHYDKADAVKSMRRIAADDKRSPTYKNRKLKVVARPIPKDHAPTRSWKKKGKKWEYNPKRGTTVPAHVRINPRTGRIQVFVTPKVAEKLRGGKGLMVAGNPKQYQVGVFGPYDSLTEAKKKAKVLARSQGLSVTVYDRDGYKKVFTAKPPKKR